MSTTRLARASFWPAVRGAFLIITVLMIAFLNVRIALAIYNGTFSAMAGTLGLGTFTLAAVVYLFGHALRVLRLALLIGGWRVGFRDITSFHLMVAAAGLIAPLRLAEPYRVLELTNLAGGLVRALAIVWCERTLDMVVLLALLLIAVAENPSEQAGFGGVTILAAGFLTATAIAFFVLPDNLRRLGVLIIRRYDSPRTIAVLRLIDQLRRSILEVPVLVQRKAASLVTLTVFIWLCEMVCFAVVLPSIQGNMEEALDALLSFLSALTEGTTLFTVISNGATNSGVPDFQYLAATQVPLALLGLFAALRYVRRRPHIRQRAHV